MEKTGNFSSPEKWEPWFCDKSLSTGVLYLRKKNFILSAFLQKQIICIKQGQSTNCFKRINCLILRFFLSKGVVGSNRKPYFRTGTMTSLDMFCSFVILHLLPSSLLSKHFAIIMNTKKIVGNLNKLVPP